MPYRLGLKPQILTAMPRIRKIHSERIENELEQGNIVLVTGFQGVNMLGDMTTLGLSLIHI